MNLSLGVSRKKCIINCGTAAMICTLASAVHETPLLIDPDTLELKLIFRLQDGKITDDTRIRASVPTLKYLSEAGARVVVSSHLGRPKDGPEDKFRLTPVAGEKVLALISTVLL